LTTLPIPHHFRGATCNRSTPVATFQPCKDSTFHDLLEFTLMGNWCLTV